jgi:hypothetical protein
MGAYPSSNYKRRFEYIGVVLCCVGSRDIPAMRMGGEYGYSSSFIYGAEGGGPTRSGVVPPLREDTHAPLDQGGHARGARGLSGGRNSRVWDIPAAVLSYCSPAESPWRQVERVLGDALPFSTSITENGHATIM